MGNTNINSILFFINNTELRRSSFNNNVIKNSRFVLSDCFKKIKKKYYLSLLYARFIHNDYLMTSVLYRTFEEIDFILNNVDIISEVADIYREQCRIYDNLSDSEQYQEIDKKMILEYMDVSYQEKRSNKDTFILSDCGNKLLSLNKNSDNLAFNFLIRFIVSLLYNSELCIISSYSPINDNKIYYDYRIFLDYINIIKKAYIK